MKKLHAFSSKKSQKKAILVVTAVLLICLVITLFSNKLYWFLSNPATIKDFITSFGPLGPIILIVLQILQVLVAPIPGQVAGFVSGYIFGVFWGTVYTMIGTTIGSYIAFVVARKYGRPFVEKVIKKKVIKKFDYICKDKGKFALFLLFLLPALPDDAICFIAGLTNIRIKSLVLITIIGRFPGFFVLNLMGNGAAGAQTQLSILIFIVMMVVSLVVYFNRRVIEDAMNQLVLNYKKRFGKGNTYLNR